jgi:hypothetical protein
MTLTSRSFSSYSSFKFRLNLLLSIDMAFSNSDRAIFPSVTCITSAADLPKTGRRLRAKDALRGRTADEHFDKASVAVAVVAERGMLYAHPH